MTTVPPVYFLIDATPDPGSNKVDHTGPFDSILVANRHISRFGPPLPVVVQCLPGEEQDLEKFLRIVKGIPGAGSNYTAQSYVKKVAKSVRHMSIWPHIPKFYVCLNGADMPKYICQRWVYISDLSSGDQAKTPSFSTFIHAFIYVIAGGDQKLRQWGMHDQWGWRPAVPRAATPSTTSDFRPPPTPSSSRAQPLAIEAPSTPTSHPQNAASYSFGTPAGSVDNSALRTERGDSEGLPGVDDGTTPGYESVWSATLVFQMQATHL